MVHTKGNKMTNIENQDNFSMQDLRDNELDSLYDELIDGLRTLIREAKFDITYLDDNDISDVISDVFEDFMLELP